MGAFSRTSAGSGSFSVPSEVRRIWVSCIGGGGGSTAPRFISIGGSIDIDSSSTRPNGGGGGGWGFGAVSGSGTISYTVGAGGARSGWSGNTSIAGSGGGTSTCLGISGFGGAIGEISGDGGAGGGFSAPGGANGSAGTRQVGGAAGGRSGGGSAAGCNDAWAGGGGNGSIGTGGSGSVGSCSTAQGGNGGAGGGGAGGIYYNATVLGTTESFFSGTGGAGEVYVSWINLTASKTTLQSGESTTVSWDSPVSSGSESVSYTNTGSSSVIRTYTRTDSRGAQSSIDFTIVPISGCTDPLATNYDSNATQDNGTCTYSPPTVSSFSVSPTSICRGSSASLSWNVTGKIDSVSISPGIGTVSSSGSRTVSPTTTTTYTLTATGPGGTTSQSVTLTVYQPTAVDLTVDNSTIIRGQSTTLRWVVTGDATSATINQGIGPVNINGEISISPTQTTTYTINVTGICTNSSDSVTLIVYQPPTVNITGPESLNYGQQATITYNATYADISLVITPSYSYKNSGVIGTPINLPLEGVVDPLHLSDGAIPDRDITTQIPYNDFGPFFANYTIVATGNGGQESKLITIPINIDETPENFLLDESKDLLKSQDPVFAPDSTVTSYEIVINDIDIPVEVKADKPILVDKNKQQDWKEIRQI